MKRLRDVSLAACVACALPSLAQAQSRDYLPYAGAAAGVEACVAMANEAGAGIGIVVIDTAAQTLSTGRLDGVLPAAFEAAGLKAYTALNFFQASGTVAAILEQVPEFRAIPDILAVAGGVPVFSASGQIVGAVGVAGFPDPAGDARCAETAAAAMTG